MKKTDILQLLPLKEQTLFFTIRANGALQPNAKAVYDAIPGKKLIFAAKLPHTKEQIARAFYLLATSKTIITDDYCRYLLDYKLKKGQRVFQLWHACGAFKKFGLDNADSIFTPEKERAYHSQYTACFVTSEKCREIYAGAFGIDKEKCLPLGLPRTDPLVNNADELKERAKAKFTHLKGKKVYLWCPTFREEKGKERVFDPKLDFDEISACLNEDEILVIKRHPLMKYDLLCREYSNIIDLTDEDTLELTALADCLVTDYSSVIFEAVLLNIPVCFYVPDLKEYERGFYLDFPHDLPGEMTENPGGFITLLRNAAQSHLGEKSEKSVKFRETQLSACDGNATKRIAAYITGQKSA